MSDFASVVRTWRETAGIQQKELAARVGISAQYLCDIERGYREPKSDKLILALSEALNCPSDYLFHYAGRIPPDCRGMDVLASTVVQAFAEMRRVLTSEQEDDYNHRRWDGYPDDYDPSGGDLPF